MIVKDTSYIQDTFAENVFYHKLKEATADISLKSVCSVRISYKSTSALIPQVLADKFASPCSYCYGRSEG